MRWPVFCLSGKEEVNREKESLTQRLIEEGRNNTIIGNLFSQWKKRPRPEEKVTGILNEIEEKNREIMTLSEQMNDLVGAGRHQTADSKIS